MILCIVYKECSDWSEWSDCTGSCSDQTRTRYHCLPSVIMADSASGGNDTKLTAAQKDGSLLETQKRKCQEPECLQGDSFVKLDVVCHICEDSS